MKAKFRVGTVSGSSINLSGESGEFRGSMSLTVDKPDSLNDFQAGQTVDVELSNPASQAKQNPGSKTGTDVGQQRR